jgi:hypothetical protein
MSESINRLNKILERELGAPHGKQRYKWAWSHELQMPFRKGEKESQTQSGLYVIEPVYSLVPMVDGDGRWVFAKLTEPPSYSEWLEAFKGEIDYPASGYYAPTSIMCRLGKQPDEDITEFAVWIVRQNESKSEAEHRQDVDAGIKKQHDDNQKVIGDVIDDAIPAFGNIPGTRSLNVSFGGV